MSFFPQHKTYSINYGGKNITIETGKMARQADGAVLMTCAGTQVLVSVCSATSLKDGIDFFPLTVDYSEKFYAAGKFLGGFIKREARPSTGEILNSRLIDRPLRPLFPEGYMYETVVQPTVLSYDESADPEVLASLGAAAAFTVSDIPFNGPMGACKVGKINGQLVLNPTIKEWANSELEIAVAASSTAILMVEGEAHEVSEQVMLEALQFAHKSIREYCTVLEKMQKEAGKPKREFTPVIPNQTLMKKVMETFGGEARKVLSINDKQERTKGTAALDKKVAEAITANPEQFGLTASSSASKEAHKAVDYTLYEMMRKDILLEGKRIGGRALTQVRPIYTEVGTLKTPHGSSLFTRGETQVLATVTIGGAEGEVMADRMTGITYQNFYLHYNFPPFSVGEAKGYRGVGRRELGHGNLAERALKNMLPSDFAYTVRINCEVLESNGSSSMGSVCSGSMAMMDAGIPMKAPVAGIAMGLIKENDNYKILSDILGDEDHLGDMDFKVAGTTKGITAIQMDIKITGITEQIFTEAMTQAHAGRLHILGEMNKSINTPRGEFKAGVPRMETIQIPTDKIGALIGPGGKNIKAVQESFKVTIEITEEGLVKILGVDQEKVKECVLLVDMQINGPKENTVYKGKVVTIKEYGAFVDIAQGVSGLVHVSEMADERVQDVNDYVSEGDEVDVKVLEIDKFGKIKLSMKAVKPLTKKTK